MWMKRSLGFFSTFFRKLSPYDVVLNPKTATKKPANGSEYYVDQGFCISVRGMRLRISRLKGICSRIRRRRISRISCRCIPCCSPRQALTRPQEGRKASCSSRKAMRRKNTMPAMSEGIYEWVHEPVLNVAALSFYYECHVHRRMPARTGTSRLSAAGIS